jgi:anaerobic ribonucleoside-triphosphate reductase
MKEEKTVHHKKHFSEEEALENVEKKIDDKMNKIMNKSFVHKFLDLKIMKDILSSHIVNDANHKLRPSLKILFTILGWISVVT